jgi:hypothetical protein
MTGTNENIIRSMVFQVGPVYQVHQNPLVRRYMCCGLRSTRPLSHSFDTFCGTVALKVSGGWYDLRWHAVHSFVVSRKIEFVYIIHLDACY